MYSKPAIEVKDQIDLLRKRGLIINDYQFAEHHLKSISYYRLAGYWWPMQSDKVNHIFKPNSVFENVIALYDFDRELRLFVFDILERIEIALRTKMIYHLSLELNPWWFEDSSFFKDQKAYLDTLDNIDRELLQTREGFIRQHYRKYPSDKRRPPAWKTVEIVSFTTLSKLFSNIIPSVISPDVVAAEFNTVNRTYLKSWLLSLSQIRNICAHHGRLWNRNLPGRPKLLKKPPAPWLTNVPPVTQHHMIYIHLCCMKYLADAVHFGNSFFGRLAGLLSKYPSVDLNALGFNLNWQTEPLWVK
ncbi:MAG: Abi family protein [Bacteroidales bacterium]|nr:Abi family protein [Bacteroidales bacterium]